MHKKWDIKEDEKNKLTTSRCDPDSKMSWISEGEKQLGILLGDFKTCLKMLENNF